MSPKLAILYFIYPLEKGVLSGSVILRMEDTKLTHRANIRVSIMNQQHIRMSGHNLVGIGVYKNEYLFKSMECPMCYDIYDEQVKIPRNLLCGHTYCQECLNNAIKNKGRLECPICRMRHDNRIKPSELTKNYVALQFSLKQRELMQKHQFCSQHKQPLKFFCQNDSQYICIDCITKHTGHRFFKQEQSLVLVKKKISQKVGSLKEELDRIKTIRSKFDSAQVCLSQRYEQSVGQAEKVFSKFRKDLDQAEQRIRGEMKKFYNNQMVQMERSKAQLEKEQGSVEKEIRVLQEKIDSLERMKVVEEKVDIPESKPRKLKGPPATEFPTLTFTYMELPRLQLNYRINPKICFFGDRKRLLMYCPNSNTYSLTTLVTQIQIQYYSACCTLPSGQIIITGGGSSNFTLLFNAWASTKLIYKKNMLSCRKQHSSVFMNGLVYAISGYDSKNKCMAGCEVYDINKDQWHPIAPLNVPRCAFAIAVTKNKIWVMGGFNGVQQIKSIEMYEESAAAWKTLQVELRMPLANSAAIATDNQIIILGGGCNEGFSLEAYQLDLQTMTISQIARMDTGRDLRNKAILYGGDIYTVGGNNYSAERYKLREFKWETLRGYGDLVQDNLDSWCCGLTYNPTDYDLDRFSEYNSNLKKKYMDYVYNEEEGYEEVI